MSNIEVSRRLLRSARNIEPVKEKRLELGKKVFKVHTQSKRKSSRIQRPETKPFQLQNKPSGIVHRLLLGPTLKRQRKKKLEREKRSRKKRYFNLKVDIQLSDIFVKKRRRYSKRRQPGNKVVTIILDDIKARAVRKKKAHIDSFKIRHLARCGGVESVSGLDIFDEIEWFNRNDAEIPPPFETRDDDQYITPQPGQLISYIWHTRPSPVLGRKRIYRTGVLRSTDGTIRFFENDDDSRRTSNEHRKFFEGRFYLNKHVFKIGNFRVRTDLVEGAICYERERKLPCKLLKVDEECGAVLIQSLRAEGSGINLQWISPDDLVGNYKIESAQRIPLENTKPCEKIGQISPTCVTSIQETIDLTEDDEDEPDPELFTPDIASPRYSSLNSLSRVLRTESSHVPYPHVQRTSDNERSVAEIVANVCTSLQPPPATILLGDPHGDVMGIGSQNLYENKFMNDFDIKPWLLERTHSDLFRFRNENTRTRDNSSILASATLVSPLRPQTASDMFGALGSSSPLSSYSSSVGFQPELGLVKQHGMALEILVTAKDARTIQAILPYIKRLQQRGVPVGPTASNLVSEAERTSLALTKESFLRHMTTSVWSGGKGYNLSHASILFGRLLPLLGSSLGRPDSPMINSANLENLGLARAEISDILPYLQTLEGDILCKSLEFRRQLAIIV